MVFMEAKYKYECSDANYLDRQEKYSETWRQLK
jgi:hypothetical protein